MVADLGSLGFIPQEPGWPDAPYHRFTRGPDIVDLLVPDHLSARIRASVMRRPVMAVDGGAQALERTMTVTLADGDGRVPVRIPDVLGALVFKAAAATTVRRDNARHLYDGALLAGLVTDYATERSRLHGHDRQRLLYLADQLEDPDHPAWTVLPTDLAQRGRDALHFLALPPTPPRDVKRSAPAMPPRSSTPRREPPGIGY
jgi:predicted nucleotidyltransferase